MNKKHPKTFKWPLMKLQKAQEAVVIQRSFNSSHIFCLTLQKKCERVYELITYSVLIVFIRC